MTETLTRATTALPFSLPRSTMSTNDIRDLLEEMSDDAIAGLIGGAFDTQGWGPIDRLGIDILGKIPLTTDLGPAVRNLSAGPMGVTFQLATNGLDGYFFFSGLALVTDLATCRRISQIVIDTFEYTIGEPVPGTHQVLVAFGFAD